MDGDERAGGTPHPDDVPRLVEWLRSERPATTTDELVVLFRDLPSDDVRRLERLLDDVARGCRPPAPADLAALTALDDRLARGG